MKLILCVMLDAKLGINFNVIDIDSKDRRDINSIMTNSFENYNVYMWSISKEYYYDKLYIELKDQFIIL